MFNRSSIPVRRFGRGPEVVGCHGFENCPALTGNNSGSDIQYFVHCIAQKLIEMFNRRILGDGARLRRIYFLPISSQPGRSGFFMARGAILSDDDAEAVYRAMDAG